MQLRQVESRPHTYIVENDYGRQLGTVCEYHPKNQAAQITYIANRFDGRGMFEQKEFSGFTAALQFVGKRV